MPIIPRNYSQISWIVCLGLSLIALSGCIDEPIQNSPSLSEGPRFGLQQTEMVNSVIQDIEPRAEFICRQSRPSDDCDFQVYVDTNDPSVNAYQVGNEPTIVFTEPMVATFRNQDEVAFVYAHEAAHYILEHHGKRTTRRVVGLLFGAVLSSGENASGQDTASDWMSLGAEIGGRIYSPQEELEADNLGAEIAQFAGYDPSRGVMIFDNLGGSSPDLFFPTHPSDGRRVEAIRSKYTAQSSNTPLHLLTP